jgi:hypothetical protein
MSRTQIFDDIEIGNEEDIPRESLFKFVARINKIEAALRFCVSRRLIPNSRMCPKCSKTMVLQVYNAHIDGLQVGFCSFIRYVTFRLRDLKNKKRSVRGNSTRAY